MPAEIAYAGTWRIDPAGSDSRAALTLAYPPTSTNRAGLFAFSDLGLARDAVEGDERAVQFELQLEAGTFVCHGSAGNGRGKGTFRFTPAPAYVAALARIGMETLELREQIQAAMFDISASFVAEISAALPQIAFSDVIAMKMFGVEPETAQRLGSYFPTVRARDILSLKMVGVTPAYVDALHRAGVRDLSIENVSALRAAGIDQAFVENLAADGPQGLSIDDVARRKG
jgi:hypothetical protein